MSFYATTNYGQTRATYQEDVVEVMREILISNLENQLSDLQCAEENGEITDKDYILFHAKRLRRSIERLQRAYNPVQEIEY